MWYDETGDRVFGYVCEFIPFTTKVMGEVDEAKVIAQVSLN